MKLLSRRPRAVEVKSPAREKKASARERTMAFLKRAPKVMFGRRLSPSTLERISKFELNARVRFETRWKNHNYELYVVRDAQGNIHVETMDARFNDRVQERIYDENGFLLRRNINVPNWGNRIKKYSPRGRWFGKESDGSTNADRARGRLKDQ